jgi:hypothetical protein
METRKKLGDIQFILILQPSLQYVILTKTTKILIKDWIIGLSRCLLWDDVSNYTVLITSGFHAP